MDISKLLRTTQTERLQKQKAVSPFSRLMNTFSVRRPAPTSAPTSFEKLLETLFYIHYLSVSPKTGTIPVVLYT